MSDENHLSHNAEKRIGLLVRDVTKHLVAGIRAVLEEEATSGTANAENADRRLREYVASVETVTLEDPKTIEREHNTPSWKSIKGDTHEPSGIFSGSGSRGPYPCVGVQHDGRPSPTPPQEW